MTDKETITTYDTNAAKLAEYFAGIGSRIDLIEEGIALAGSPSNARAVEVGCGDGRDAADIIPRVGWYEGFDPSAELIKLAQKRLPAQSFVVADALGYNYPKNLDVIYGFASFLHLNRDDFATASDKAAEALRLGGILLITLKERDSYQEELVEDEYGKRMFYYYDEATVRELAGSGFEVVKIEHQTLKRKTARWLVVALRKL